MAETNCEIKKTDEKKLQEYKAVVADALKALGKKNLTLIIHGASFPSVCPCPCICINTGMGSPNSEGAKALVDFVKGIFNGIQLGPAGKTKSVDSSPYTGTIFSNNTLFIDLHELTQPKWGGILSESTLTEIITNNPNKDTNKVAYGYIFSEQEKALREAYNTFKKECLKNKVLKVVNKKFEKFIKANFSWLEKDALYEALSVKHNNDYWPMWKDETDKNLFNPQNDEQAKTASLKIDELKRDFALEIDYYYFCQFVADSQKQDMIKFALDRGVKLIADRQVAFSDRDCWANQALFLKGWKLGCPPDYFSKDGQAWGFPVMDPEKLFNPDGSLGEGGELLKAVFKKMFKENPGGVRIDHIIGLIDPWVYKEGKKPKPEDGAGRLFSSPEHLELSKYAIVTMDDIDKEYDSDSEDRIKKLTDEQVRQYGALLEKIVTASAVEEGQDKNSIICEDLGTLTYPVKLVMEKMELSGMSLTQFVNPEKPSHPYRGVNTKPHAWIMTGTHDNEPIAMWAKKISNTQDAYHHAKSLAEDLLCEDLITDPSKREDYITVLIKTPEELVKAKFTELFASPAENVQIFFSDFFGIYDVYNKPGTSGDKNWSLRLPDNFEEYYYEQLSDNKGLNLPEILKKAFEAKGSEFVSKNPELYGRLNEFAGLLK